MKTLEDTDSKIEKICEALRKETLEPAQQEAEKIVTNAKEQAKQLVDNAHKEAAAILTQAKKDVEAEHNIFESSLQQAAKQAIERIKQEIEGRIFNDELENIVASYSSDPKIIASLIDSIVKGIEKEGINADLQAVIPKSISPEAISVLLSKNIMEKLRQNPFVLGDFAGGAKVIIKDRKMRVEMTDQDLKELVAGYTRKDFRKTIFAG